MSMKHSVLPPREHALRVSSQACPHAENIILSAGGTESMILSARAESIILSVPPAESMILSKRRLALGLLANLKETREVK